MPAKVNRIGLRYGRLTVLSEAPGRADPDGRVRLRYNVRCDCGTELVAWGTAMGTGNTQSCGCFHKDRVSETQTIHGESRKGHFTLEYNTYVGMVQRCRDPKHSRYKDYGGRGINVCSRWLNGEDGLTGYECFLADMGRRPTKGHTLDRENNDRGYSPQNCRWATNSEQQLNKRR